MRRLISLLIISILVFSGVSPAGAAVPTQQKTVQAPATTNSPASNSLPLVLPRERLSCEAFGCFMFGGDFAREKTPVFSPEYVVAIGDKISIQMWGSVDYEQIHVVDAQGNIFLPKVGPVKVLGVKNKDLTEAIMGAVRTVYVRNVGLYAGLLETQPVIVYVTGGVVRPGAYGGTSANSLMYYLDSAGGIEPAAGSYLDISIIRGMEKIRTFNLYDFILAGEMPAFQFADGDTILVNPRRKTVKVSGLVANPYRFEFEGETIIAGKILEMAAPRADATHMRVVRNSRRTRDVEYFSLRTAQQTILNGGDEVTILSDKTNGTITVRFEGEHLGAREVALPYGARLSDALNIIQYAPTADQEAVQLFRSSVAERQKEMLQESLNKLEASVLTARSSTAEEAKLRKDEAELFLQWIERAKKIEPRGQVVIAGGDPQGIILENGDIIRIPSDNALVMVHGEVLFPSTIAYRPGMRVADAIEQSGGYSQAKGTSRIVVLSRDGSYQMAGKREKLEKGDEVLVLPQVDTKYLQFGKDIMQVLYQIAVSAAVVLRI
jgi:protein involved in polysaccharide export with SLBB domain